MSKKLKFSDMKTCYPLSPILLIPLISLLLLSACKNDDPPSQTDLLCHDWKVAKLFVEDQSGQQFEAFLGVEITLKFTADKQAIMSSNNETDTAIWSWTNDEKSVRLQTTSGSVTYDVQKLTDQELWIRFQSAETGNYLIYKCERI
jgi:hypothetical protein